MCLLLCIASPSVLNGYVKRDPSFGISLELVRISLLVSAHCHLRFRDCCESFVFKSCQTVHVACTFAELLEKIDHRTNRELKDSSNQVKSGYAAMIKL